MKTFSSYPDSFCPKKSLRERSRLGLLLNAKGKNGKNDKNEIKKQILVYWWCWQKNIGTPNVVKTAYSVVSKFLCRNINEDGEEVEDNAYTNLEKALDFL